MFTTLSLLFALAPASNAGDTFDLVRGAHRFGTDARQYAGYRLAPLGDLDGDGFGDVAVAGIGLVGTPGLLLYRGDTLGLSAPPEELFDTADDEGCCHELAVGDLDGDGLIDVIVGRRVSGPKGYIATIEVHPGDGSSFALTPSVVLADPYKPQEQSSWGQVFDVVGDVNGDGYDDLAVGVTRYSSTTVGQVWIYLGGASGLSATPAFTLEAPDGHTDFGEAVSKAGDVNADGFDDLIVGNPRSTSSESKGVAYLFYGGGVQGLSSFTQLDETNTTFEYGTTVAGGGDINGDGYDDVIVADPRECDWREEYAFFFVYWGDPVEVDKTKSQRVACGGTSCGYFGDSLELAGDVDGDGLSEVIVGVPHWGNDHALVYRGTPSGLSASPLNWLWSDFGSKTYATSVGPAGDLNGDGLADLLVSDTYGSADMRGAVQPWLGGPVIEGETDTAKPDTGEDTGEDTGGDTGTVDSAPDSDTPDEDSPTPDAEETATPDDTGVPSEDKDGGCGCVSGEAPTGAGLLALGLLGLAGRRRRADLP